jgi:two-component system NtrC family response regulator
MAARTDELVDLQRGLKSEERFPMRMASVLIVDNDPEVRNLLQRGLRTYFGLVETAEDAETAETIHKRCYFDLIIIDIRLPGRAGVEWVMELRERGGQMGVIFMTADADFEKAVSALRAGAIDFIMKPFRMEQIMAAIKRYFERQKGQSDDFVLRRKAQEEQNFDFSGIIGSCARIKDVCQVIRQVAPMPSTVLIEGESGTGKELVARAIHDWSGRSGSFVPINCGAISAELLESELFGHMMGAFTGAHRARDGLFTYANGGTLFLDEIGEMPLSMQAHLLRVLEARRIRPVGSNREIPVDVRIIAVTNRDLGEQVRNGSFREDLYYRLNVLLIRMPSLRERLDDIPALAKHFVDTLAAELGVAAPSLDAAEISCLCAHDWPGNVRELKNVIERCLLLGGSPGRYVMELAGSKSAAGTAEVTEELPLAQVEKLHILRVLELEGGNKSAAARLLGISRKTLERKVQVWSRG